MDKILWLIVTLVLMVIILAAVGILAKTQVTDFGNFLTSQMGVFG